MTIKKLIIASLFVVLAAGAADAGKGKPGGGGGGVSTNYGCGTLKAGTVLTSATSQKTLLMATSACYLCNMSTMVCAIQSPSTLVGWSFVLR